MPRHLQSPVHQLMLEISTRPEWNDRMEGARAAITVESPAFYYDLLQPQAARIDLWETEYLHVLENPAAILAWIRGSGLRPYLESLDSDIERRRFEELLLAGLEQAYPRRVDGRVLFPFRRLFFVAYVERN
jgi:trans-aconitate 2-methyltransferase